jgi:hypothetical protein
MRVVSCSSFEAANVYFFFHEIHLKINIISQLQILYEKTF